MELFPRQSHISRPRQVGGGSTCCTRPGQSERRDGHVAARLTPQVGAKKDSGGYEVAA